MNALDIIVIAVIILSGLFAFARGFVKEALSVCAWVGAGFAALYARPFAMPIAERFLPAGAIAGRRRDAGRIPGGADRLVARHLGGVAADQG